jgi:hypothetical protein
MAEAEGMTPQVEALARNFLRLHDETQGTTSSLMFFHEEAWWLCRAENQPGSDTAQRPRSRVLFSRLGDVDGDRLLQLLETAASAKELAPPDELVQASTEPLLPRRTAGSRRALLALLLNSRIAVVKDAEEARWVQTRMATSLLALMSIKGRIPGGSQLPNALVIASSEWLPSRVVDDLLEQLGERDVPEIGGLLRVPPADRPKLLQSWLNQETLDASTLSDPQKAWLLMTGTGRTELIAGATAEARRQWLGDGLLTLPEIKSASWTEADHPALLQELVRIGADPELFFCLAGPKARGIERLFNPELTAAWEWARNSAEAAPPANAGAHVEDLARWGLLNPISHQVVCRILHRFPGPTVQKIWRVAVQELGVAMPLIRALMGESHDSEALACSTPPSATVDPSWVAGVPAGNLMKVAAWACQRRAWRDWWRRSLMAHPETQAFAKFGPELPYQQCFLDWLLGELQDGSVTPASALQILAKWLKIDPKPATNEIGTILRECRIKNPEAWAARIENPAVAPEQPPEPEDNQALVQLCAAAVLSEEQVLNWVEQGAPVRWLDKLQPEAAISLLDVSRIPPVGPPEWPPHLDPLLARAVQSADFWSRWQAVGVSPDLADWIALRLRSLPGGTLAANVAGALAGRTVLANEDLQIAGSGLPSVVMVEQFSRWAHGRAPNRRKALETILRLAPTPEIVWLSERTIRWAPGSTLPTGFNARQLTALLPWLRKTTVIEIVLERKERDLDEPRLLEGLIADLRTTFEPPPPPPPREAVERRADWIAELEKLPGWAGWSAPVEGGAS